MALIKYGPLAEEVSGTVGGVTFARIRGAKACRGWRAPTNKSRSLQLEVRRALALAAATWFNDLTQTQRNGWDTYAPTCSFTNPLGEAYTITGYNMFVRNHSLYTLFGGWAHDVYEPADEPQDNGFPTNPTLTLTLTHSTGAITLTNIVPALATNEAIAITVYKWMKASRQYPHTPRFDREFVDDGDTPPFSVSTYGVALPGSAGDAKAVMVCRFVDGEERVSKPWFEIITST